MMKFLYTFFFAAVLPHDFKFFTVCQTCRLYTVCILLLHTQMTDIFQYRFSSYTSPSFHFWVSHILWLIVRLKVFFQRFFLSLESLPTFICCWGFFFWEVRNTFMRISDSVFFFNSYGSNQIVKSCYFVVIYKISEDF